MTVAPVVVKPDTASNTASVNERSGTSLRKSGVAPASPRKTQNTETIRKPSRRRSSRRVWRAGSQSSNPADAMTAAEAKNGCQCPSA